ncbi:MAG TPA: DUF3426 domain-containing protein [Geminicoccus sp.]|jgi:predicted Zn finger-like uncharacterized protein|uniref:DUF3426 domain-containing protein n=1 Tax=Geminicoccus sp. TaxID=2024832 RepID=UPI002E38063F|nr:DUF3426 domain-containing protein [Geminicoccus sp.]HEX2526992.1 DUF3426 domain-containing protein [Geminicoccus sp.]
MIVTCPNCAAKYRIDSAAIGERGRMVSCANCRHRWFVDPQHTATESATAPPPPAPDPVRPGETSGTVRPGSRSSRLGWIVLLVLVTLVAGAVLARDRIATMWPQTAGVYRLVGLSVTIDPGIEIRGVTSAETQENGVRVLVVTGEVVNTTDYARTVPPLHVSVLDDDRKELVNEIIKVEPAILEARATVRFETRVQDVPPEARHTAVRLENRP